MTENDPKPIPRKTPKKKGEGPSMREQILARKRAAAQADGAAEPAAEVAPKKSAAKAAARPSRGTARSSGGRSTPRTTAKRGGDSDDGEGERTSKRSRRERPKKKKSPVPLIATAGLLLAAAIGAFMVLGGSDESPEETAAAPAGEDAAGTPADAPADAPADTPAETTPEAAPSTDANADTPDDAAADAAADPEPSTKPEPAAPTDVDLSTLEPFGMPVGATAEEWTKLQEDAATFFDVDAGAAGGRASRRLEAAGKLAWPAILNEMIKLDPGNPEDNMQGMLAQRALNAARGSQTSQAFDWRTPDDGVLSEKNCRYNRKLIKALYDSWAKVVADPSHWDRIDKSEASAEAKSDTEKKLEDEFEFDPSDLEGLDG